jgi:hypothetical protein
MRHWPIAPIPHWPGSMGLYRPVHVKTLPSQKLRMTHCKLLQSKAIAIENDLRGNVT